ncbi:thiamine pyrophosphate-dependent dehydrogenase E1 component subunit alpha [Micromonospora yasonensis]|uniref:thiamine pyrophosphate-dependent dehydrogenase E1 component subunit alpha n=1 Tax=Micromonospora yasonensis TaxID=1128667 RepID=UPI00222E244F|nr:thiamine pyrophosphate-dependent dehydrogenase E1 component subunit alpha [Micromonospora yasonensis]MCW3841244.1 thiamine pyrophosphate-dependent dehydrogenase E1 component subunit alpha [Micromonospora yasonensis]
MTAAVTGARPDVPTRLAADDLDLLLLIRHFELALLDMFGRGELHGTTHTCLGQEYVPVALRPLLTDGDHVFSNHRGHGHYLARFADPHGLLAEVMGRQGAVCHGVGGSQHILRDRYLSTGVQGESVPVAAGVALHLNRAEPGHLALVHLGDGTWGEGAVYEGLNMAALWGLPLLLVVEHNGIAQSTPTDAQLAGSIEGRARAFGVDHTLVTATDTALVRAALAPVLRRVREESRPAVVELRTHRVGPHSKGDDSRTPEEIAYAKAHDWYARYAEAYPEQFAAHDERQRAYLAEVVREVAGRPASVWEEADRG